MAALVGLAVGAAWLKSTTPTYVATTNLLLDPITEKLASGDTSLAAPILPKPFFSVLG